MSAEAAGRGQELGAWVVGLDVARLLTCICSTGLALEPGACSGRCRGGTVPPRGCAQRTGAKGLQLSGSLPPPLGTAVQMGEEEEAER